MQQNAPPASQNTHAAESERGSSQPCIRLLAARLKNRIESNRIESNRMPKSHHSSSSACASRCAALMPLMDVVWCFSSPSPNEEAVEFPTTQQQADFLVARVAAFPTPSTSSISTRTLHPQIDQRSGKLKGGCGRSNWIGWRGLPAWARRPLAHLEGPLVGRSRPRIRYAVLTRHFDPHIHVQRQTSQPQEKEGRGNAASLVR